MRTVVRLLWALCAFGLGLGTVYWFRTYEWVGAIALWSFGLMPLIVAVWAIRSGATAGYRPQDDPDADPADASDEVLGSFPLASVWPVVLVAGVLVTQAALVYGTILLPVGLALLGWAVLGLMRESRG